MARIAPTLGARVPLPPASAPVVTTTATPPATTTRPKTNQQITDELVTNRGGTVTGNNGVAFGPSISTPVARRGRPLRRVRPVIPTTTRIDLANGLDPSEIDQLRKANGMTGTLPQDRIRQALQGAMAL